MTSPRDTLVAALRQLKAQVTEVRIRAASVNDPDYDQPKARILHAVSVADDLLAEHLPQPRRLVVRALDGLAGASRQLLPPVGPADDADLGFALRTLRGALGQFRLALDEARDQAAAAYPGVPPPADRPGINRTAADREAVQAVLARLDDFERAVRAIAREAGTAPDFAQQGELVTGYVRGMAFSINLNRLLLTAEDFTIDVGAVVTAVETMQTLTGEFRATVTDWFGQVTRALFLRSWDLEAPSRRLVAGVRALGGMIDPEGEARFVADEPAMVLIQPGSFLMGIPAAESKTQGGGWDQHARPVHRVTLRHLFLLGRYPVTRGEYAAFARDTGRTPEPPDFEQTDRHPAVNVAFADAVAYTEWLSARTGLHYRLPSEAEWEYACRAGTTTAHYWGDSFDPALANNNDKGTTEAGAYKPNPWGLYDMIGNVFEWVADPWHDDYKGAPKDGSVWTTSGSDGRVVRGGAWSNDGRSHRSGDRIWGYEGSRPWVGFRLARTL